MKDQRLVLWHQAVFEKNSAMLAMLLDESVEFHSPTVFKPKQGKMVTHFILQSVADIFEDFSYHRQWLDGNDFALEFSAMVGDKKVKGIDLIRWNEQGKIIHFEVLLRPLNGLQLMLEKMTEKLLEAGLMTEQ